jgi:hypothetical protein
MGKIATNTAAMSEKNKEYSDSPQGGGTISPNDINADIDANLREAEREVYVKIATGEDLLLRGAVALKCLLEPFFQTVGLVCLAGS